MSSTTAASGGLRANRYLFYGLAAVSQLMFAVDSSIVTVALRTIVVDLDTSLALAGWILTGYALDPDRRHAGRRQARRAVRRDARLRHQRRGVHPRLAAVRPRDERLHADRLPRCSRRSAAAGSCRRPSRSSRARFRSRAPGCSASLRRSFRSAGSSGRTSAGLLLEHFSWRVLFLVNVPVGLIVVLLLARQIATYDRGAADTEAAGRGAWMWSGPGCSPARWSRC